jgi:tetratricopeptide (TPR) repeat protein
MILSRGSDMKLKMISAVVVLITMLVGCTLLTSAPKNDQPTAANRLFMKSWSNPSNVQRTQIRADLAANYPETAEGLFSKAWLVGKNGDDESKNRYYRECLDKYPDFMPAMWNYNFSLNDAESRAMREKMMRVDPAFFHGTVVRQLYDLESDNSIAAVAAFIAQWENTLGPDHYVFDFIRALNYQYDHDDYPQAASYYEKALATADGVLNFEVWEKYLDLKMGKLFDPATMDEHGRLDTLSLLEEAIEIVQDADIPAVEKGKFAHKAYKLMAKKVAKLNKLLGLEFYKKALDAYFTGEVAEEVYNILWGSMQREEARDFLEDSAKKYPQNYKVLENLAHLYSRQQNYPAADEFYRRAIANTHIIENRWTTTSYYCDDVLYPAFKADEAYQLLKPLAERFSKKAWGYNVLTKNRLLAGDYAQADNYIKMAFADQEGKGNTPTTYMKRLRRQVAAFVRRDRQLEEVAPVEKDALNQPVITAMTNVDANWVAVSPDQKTFFGNSGTNGDYTLWDAERFVTLKTFKNFLPLGSYIKNSERIRPIFSPDGQYLAYANSFETFGNHYLFSQ